MARFPARFETIQDVARLDGQVDFTDPTNTPASARDGSVVPVANATGVIVDTTTYDDNIKGSGKLATLVFPAEQGAIAIAIAGDAFPRWLFSCDPRDYGLLVGDGTYDPTTEGGFITVTAAKSLQVGTGGVAGTGVVVSHAASAAGHIPQLQQVSPRFSIANGALPTQQLVSTVAAQLAEPGLTRDVETITPVTFNPTAGAAATCKVELSPDNVTFSTLGIETEPAGVALDGTVHLIKVRVPATWRIKLTTVNAVLGLTTYY